MSLSVKNRPYCIPEYSLTGDLLSFLRCELQYRYYNKGALTPSTPVQQWFGEFIHGVMEEAYYKWDKYESYKNFSWDWDKLIRPIELEVVKRLNAKKLYAPYNTFCGAPNSGCTCGNKGHKLLASQRAEAVINTWGPDLFPLISASEVKLKGNRQMISSSGNKRADYYGITGVVDVISSVNFVNKDNNELVKKIEKILGNSSTSQSGYEIIIDYKGTRRPLFNSLEWQHHEWQVLTYAWLRQKETGNLPIAGGLIYINELVPSNDDMESLVKEVNNNQTDVMPTGQNDKNIIGNWASKKSGSLSDVYKKERSIRLIPINENNITSSLREFDKVVERIEDSIIKEMQGTDIKTAWQTSNTPDQKTCTACDFKYSCPKRAVITLQQCRRGNVFWK